jgi:NAD(P)H-hydrate epimerase
MARLLGVERGAVAAARLRHARRAAAEAGAIVVLKGDDTLVAAPDGTVAVSPGATPALATAGTGDVLSGILGAMLAKRVEPFAAACAAVILHALAGRRAAETHGAEGVIASDVIAALPRSRA